MSKQHIDLRTPQERIEQAVGALTAEGVNGAATYQNVAAQSQVVGLGKALVAKGLLTEQEIADACLGVQVAALEELLGKVRAAKLQRANGLEQLIRAQMPARV